MALPDHIECSVCHERFFFPFRKAYYYTGSEPVKDKVRDADLLPILTQSAWCIDCDMLSLVEDILPLRDFENAFGAVRAGHKVDYPVYFSPSTEAEQHAGYSEDVERELAEIALEGASAYLRWRTERRHASRALCCGSTRFQRLDDASCKIRHADCEFGFLLQPFTVSSGVTRAAMQLNERLYSAEGELIGLLTLRIGAPNTGEDMWKVEPLHYSSTTED